MTKSGWTKLAVTCAAIVLLIYFRSAIYYGISEIGHGIWEVVSSVSNLVIFLAIALWNLLVAGAAVAASALTFIAGVAISAFAVLLSAVGLIFVLLFFVRHIVQNLNEIAKQVGDLRLEFREETKRAAVDATFLALLGALSALVAYMATDDFLKEITTIRFLAMGAIGMVAAKLFFFFPSRFAKISGAALTVVIVVGSASFIISRYDLLQDATTWFAHLRGVLLDPTNRVKLLLVAIIAILFMLALLYPFSWAEWRRMIWLKRAAGDRVRQPA